MSTGNRLSTAVLAEAIPQAEVAVVLVNWCGWKDTVACLDSLLAATPPSGLRIVIADNCSADDSIREIVSSMSARGTIVWLADADVSQYGGERVSRIAELGLSGRRSVSLLCNKDNYGFAAANNIGMAYSEQRYGADYFWILNNDTVVAPDALARMLARMQADDTIGMCGSALLFHNAADRVQAYGGVHYNYWTGRGWHIGAGESYRPTTNPEEIEKQLSYVSGASMLVSRAFYRQIGPMSETYFLYNEELDWAWRGRGRFRLACEPRAIVIHKEGASIGTGSEDRPASLFAEFLLSRNKLRFTSRWVPWCLPTVWATLGGRMIKHLANRRWRHAAVALWAILGRQEPDARWTTKRNFT